MSYLNLGSVPVGSNTKATISLWFRIPAASLEAAAQEFEAAWGNPDSEFQYGNGWLAGGPGFTSYSSQPPQMAGIIPLLVFGTTGEDRSVSYTEKVYGSFVETSYNWQYTDFPNGEWLVAGEITEEITGQVFTTPPEKTWATEPSYIGVWCTANPKRSLLAVNLETGARAASVSGTPDVADIQANDRQFYQGPIEQIPPRTWTKSKVWADLNPSPLITRTECFRTHPFVGDVKRDDVGFGITVTPDQWHHILLSFDLSAPSKVHGVSSNDPAELAEARNSQNPSSWVDSAPQVWIAFDDVNQQNGGLSYYWIGKGGDSDAVGADPNSILSTNAWRVASSTLAADYSSSETNLITKETSVDIVTGLSKPTLDSGVGLIQVGGKPMGLPGTSEWVDHIHQVEMAEFQMWVGAALDTNGEANRRAFVDADGKPVPPDKQPTADDPQPGSIALMGRKPDVMLHVNSNWIAGTNTGSSGIDADGNLIADGQFNPIGGIEKYMPDPSLGA